MQPIGIGLSVEFHHTFPFPFSPLLLFCFSSRSCNHQTFKKTLKQGFASRTPSPLLCPSFSLSPAQNKHCFVVVQFKQKTEIINCREDEGIFKKEPANIVCVCECVCVHACMCVCVFVWKWVCASFCLLFVVSGRAMIAQDTEGSSSSRKPQLQQQP